MIQAGPAALSVSSFAGAELVTTAPIGIFTEGNGLTNEVVEMMEYVEEQVGEPISTSSICHQNAKCMPYIVIAFSASRIRDYC